MILLFWLLNHSQEKFTTAVVKQILFRLNVTLLQFFNLIGGYDVAIFCFDFRVEANHLPSAERDTPYSLERAVWVLTLWYKAMRDKTLI